jgi:DNA-binding NtrC family response regulator
VATILCLGLDSAARAGVTALLEALGHSVLNAPELRDVPAIASRVAPINLVVVHGDRWRLPADALDGIDWGSGMPAVIVMTARVAQIPSIPLAGNVVVSYLSEPVVPTTLFSTVRLTLELAALRSEVQALRGVQELGRRDETLAAPAADGRRVAESIGFDLSNAERLLIDEALRASRGNRTVAARLLGIHVRTLRRKLRPQAALAAS